MIVNKINISIENDSLSEGTLITEEVINQCLIECLAD